MSGIYIKGMEMPKDFGKTITIYPNGTVRVWVNNKGSGELLEQRAVPVPEHGQVLKVLKTERECVSRNCDRECGKCDLSLERDEIITAYDVLISMIGSVKE